MMTLKIECGETRHVRLLIRSAKQEDFTVNNGTYELKSCKEADPEDAGEAKIIDRCILDVVVSPMKRGDYNLEFNYKIADETYIDVVRLQVM